MQMNIAAKRRRTLHSAEDEYVLTTLGKLRDDLAHVHQSLDTVTDPILIDSFIFEMNAIHMKYMYYMRLCKERGIIADIF